MKPHEKRQASPVFTRYKWFLLSLCFIFIFLIALLWWNTRTPKLELPYLTSRYVVVMELESGDILYEKDSDTPHSPASLTKLMTLLLVLDDVEQGILHCEDTFTVTPLEANALGSKYGMLPGEVFTVRQLVAGAVMSSGCDCIQALVKLCAKDEASFVKRMNEKAAALGMQGSSFANATGIDAAGHYMTAENVAILARTLVLEHPEILEFTSLATLTEQGRTFRNTHRMVGKDSRVIGLKTGTTQIGGYNLVTCAQENGQTYLIVLMDSSDDSARFSETSRILDVLFEEGSNG